MNNEQEVKGHTSKQVDGYLISMESRLQDHLDQTAERVRGGVSFLDKLSSRLLQQVDANQTSAVQRIQNMAPSAAIKRPSLYISKNNFSLPVVLPANSSNKAEPESESKSQSELCKRYVARTRV
jgi:hypothetical protein